MPPHSGDSMLSDLSKFGDVYNNLASELKISGFLQFSASKITNKMLL
nr:hypothetical protein [Nostoc sp. EkiNYC01]